MIDGLSHITFIVSDLDKMEVILMKVLDAKKIYDSGDRTYSLSKERFFNICLLYTSPSPRDGLLSRMPSSA